MTQDTNSVSSHSRPFRVTLGASVFVFAAMVTTAALAGSELSEATQAKMNSGYWTGDAKSMRWQVGPDKSYDTATQLSLATAEKMNGGHWSGDAKSMRWQVGPDKPYDTAPRLSEATIDKMKEGRWEGSVVTGNLRFFPNCQLPSRPKGLQAILKGWSCS